MSAARHRPIVARLVPALLLALGLALVFGRLKDPSALLSLWRPWAEIGALACGMTAVLVSGGIDLSVGSVVALCSVVLGLSWSRLGLPIAVACALAVLTGALVGALNGTLVALGIAPLMATLATLACYSGLAMALSGGERIAGFPRRFVQLGQGDLWGLPGQFWLLLGVAPAWSTLLHLSRFGRSLFAIGDNRTAAEFAALPVRRREWWLYTLNGLLAGLVALFLTAREGASIPDPGPGLELEVIAGVVLGGTRVTGGAGGVGRTLLGVAVLANLEIGLRLLDNVTVRLPGAGLALTLDANGRLIILGVLFLAVAVLNERLAGSRPRI